MRHAFDTMPSFRALVERLVRSDVLVYVLRDLTLGSLMEGQISFMGRAGGVRYLRVQVAWQRDPRSHIVIMAHELRHAVEIAEMPDVVDSASLAREYRLRHSPPQLRGVGLAFETTAAIRAGERARAEYRTLKAFTAPR
jgi:hypothetical protein